MAKNTEKPPKPEAGKTLRDQMEKWKEAMSDKEEKDVKELETIAASEDVEFKKYENHFFDVKKNLEEFESFVKNHGLEKGPEEIVADLRNKKEEMKSLLEKKNYQKFTDSQNIFDDILESLYMKIEKATAEVEQEKKEQEKETAPVAAKTKEKEQAEQERRDRLYNEHQQNFSLLVRVIKGADKNEGGKRNLVRKYDKQMRTLQAFLDTANQTRNPNVFQINIKNFGNDFKSLLANLEPDLKEIFDNGGVLPKKEKEPIKKVEPVIEKPTEEIEPITEDQIIEKKPIEKINKSADGLADEIEEALKWTKMPIEEKPIIKPKPKKPEGAIEVSQEYLHRLATEKPITAAGEIESKKTTAPVSEPKKGLWSRFKEVVFDRETKKVAKKVSYDTATSILGVKLVTDAVRWWRKGEGDLADWWKGRKESKDIKDAIILAQRDLVESLEKTKGNKSLAEYEKVENRTANFKAKVESVNIAPEAKKALLERLLEIAKKHQEGADGARQERETEMRRVLDAYLQAKVSGIKITRDAMNFALTATGFPILRGLAYAGASVGERWWKAHKSYKQQEMGKEEIGSETKFVVKDFAKAAIETAHALIGQAGKKDVGGVKRTIDSVKAWGTMLRGFGIYGLAAAGTTAHEQLIDKFLTQIKEQGVAVAVSDNFIHNVERVAESAEHAGHLVTHPTEIFESKDSAAPRPAEEAVVTPTEQTSAPEYTAQEDVGIPVPEEKLRSIDMVTLDDSEGVLHGGNRLMRAHPELFKHEDGESWTADEIHKWRVEELKNMGFKFEGDKWGYPMTVHEGAQVELFTDASGRPHFKLASDEHITWRKNYKWMDTEPDNATAGAPHREVEVAHEPVKVEESLKETAVVHYESMPAPEAEVIKLETVITEPEKVSAMEKVPAAPEPYADAPINKFLVEHGSNQKEFFDTLQNMRGSAARQMESSLIRTEGSDKFLQEKINYLYESQENYQSALQNGTALNKADLNRINKLLQVEKLYQSEQTGWMKELSKTVFSKDDDRVMQLALASHPDVASRPILTNNSHAVRIWNTNEKKDVFWYEENKTFNLDKKGNLIIKDSAGEEVMTKEEALRMANEI